MTILAILAKLFSSGPVAKAGQVQANKRPARFQSESLERRELMAAFTWEQAKFGSYSYSTGVDISPTNPDVKLLRTDFGGAYRWIPNAGPTEDQWQPVTDNIIAADDRRLTDMDADSADDNGMVAAEFDRTDPSGNTLWLMTQGGVYRTTNFAGTAPVEWQNLNFPTEDRIPKFNDARQEQFPVHRMDRSNRLLIDPANAQVVYAGTVGSGLYRTLNGGQTWAQVSTDQIPSISFAIKPNNYDGNPNNLISSTSAVSFVVADPTGGTTTVNGVTLSKNVYVGVRGVGVFQSQDGGTTYQRITGGAGQPPTSLIADRQIFEANWNRTTFNAGSAIVDPEGNLYVTFTNFKDATGGIGYQQDESFGGGVWRYSAGQWVNMTPEVDKSYNALALWRSPQSTETRLFVGEADFAHDNALFFTNNPTASQPTWTEVTAKAEKTINELPGQIGSGNGGLASITIDPADPTGKTAWATGGWTNYRTTDVTNPDATWTEVARGHEELFGFDVEVAENGVLHFLAGDRGGVIANTADLDGRRHQLWSWSKPGYGLPAGQYTSVTNYTFVSGTGVGTTPGNADYVARVGDAWGKGDGAFSGYSVDGGKTWKPFAGQPPSQFYSFGGQIRASATVQEISREVVDATGFKRSVIERVPTSLVWTTSESGEVFASKDNGATWVKSNLKDESPFWIPNGVWGGVIIPDRVDGNAFYAVGSWTGAGLAASGVSANWFYSNDGGVTWSTGSQTGSNGRRVVPDVLGAVNPTPVPGLAHGVFLSSEQGSTDGVNQGGLYFSAAANSKQENWVRVNKVGRLNSMAIGAPAQGQKFGAVYVLGVVELNGKSEYGIYRSDDLLLESGNINPAATWVQMANQESVMTNSGQPIPFTLSTYGQSLEADPLVHGRIYLSMTGRGMMYGGIAGERPNVTSPATASLNANGLSATLNFAAADDAGEKNLQYFWRTVSAPQDALLPEFALNGVNAAKSTQVKLFASGDYEFEAKATDAGGQTITNRVRLTVGQVATKIGPLTDGSLFAAPGSSTQLFVYDQFNLPFQRPITWTVKSAPEGARVDANGQFIAGANSGPAMLSAQTGGVSLDAFVQVRPATLDYSQGFTSAENLMFNINPNSNWGEVRIRDQGLELITKRWTNDSAFDKREVDVSTFAASFRVRMGTAGQFGDGLVLVISGDGPNQVGPARNPDSLGFADDPNDNRPNAFANSVALKLDPWQSVWPNYEPVSRTGVYTRGEVPATPDIDLEPSGINFHNGNPVDVHLSYQQGELAFSITDSVTGATHHQRYTLDLPAILGKSTAHLGFAASSESSEIEQPLRVERFAVFTGPAPQVAQGLQMVPGRVSTAKLSWNAVSGELAGFVLERATDSSFTTGLVQQRLLPTATGATAHGLVPNTTYHFRLRSLNAVGDSMTPVMSLTTANVELLPGDATDDGRVDISDFVLLRNDFGRDGVLPADFNGDGRVDLQDFVLIRRNFGKVANS